MANSEIRVGRVSSINYKTGMARVTYEDKDEAVTSEFPMLNFNDEYRMPKVGQTVMVAHMSNGSSRGVILGTVWNQAYNPAETGAGLYRKDLSRKKDAAYIRYDDKTGEYLVKVANMHLNGINKTQLDGPVLEIAANISILIQTESMQADVAEVLVTGGETGTVNVTSQADIVLKMEENPLKAVIMEAAMELIEKLEIKAGTTAELEAAETVAIKAGTGAKMEAEEAAEVKAGTTATLAGKNVKVEADGTLRLQDGENDTTLKEIMDRLKALEGG